MKCLYCNGDMVLIKDIFHADRFGIHLTIDHLPVYKCVNCGEILVETEQVKLIQKTLSELEDSLGRKAA
ncbi:MAG: hypothetical protein A2Z20_11640 [Bdellovibrionales bacterium RBG_16_40_8]|nr:MAG: hypothetical protein A2Z20_11640 [Bdellovibrionales bacterium RBG_16_40_8]